MAGKFKKGQTVFQASSNFATVAECAKNGDVYIPSVSIGIVVEREVDSCGAKQITFTDRGGNDSIFSKKFCFAWGENIFSTAEEAFAALKSDVICPDVYSDANKNSFNDFRNGIMRITAK